MITEFGGDANAGCFDLLNGLLDYMEANEEWIGWTAVGSTSASHRPRALETANDDAVGGRSILGHKFSLLHGQSATWKSGAR